MDTLHYNMRFGYLDAFVRAQFSGFLTEAQYLQLKQCETVDDIRLQLSNAGFQEYFRNDIGQCSPMLIYERCRDRMVSLFNEVDCQAQDELKEFFQWLRIPFMIDNVVLLISGINRNRNISDLIERCHPLGLFDGIKSLVVATTPEELYQNVLIDTPLGPLFQKSINKNALSEQNVEIIRLSLYREYFQGFYNFCEKLGGETAEMMREILTFEADRRSIVITLNSLKTALIVSAKEDLYPTIGSLYPHATHLLTRAQTEADVARILDGYEIYRNIWSQAVADKTIEDVFYEKAAAMNVESFAIYFQFGVFYSWIHLLDQEVRNIQWIAECIHQRKPEKADNYVRIRK